MKRYLVMCIGCIECGVSSAVAGVFYDCAEADAFAEQMDSRHSWRQGGQNSFEVFEIDVGCCGPLGEFSE